MNQTGTTDVDGSAAWDTATGRTVAGTVRADAVLDSGISLTTGTSPQRSSPGGTSSPPAPAKSRIAGGTGRAWPGSSEQLTNNGVGAAGGCPECVLMNGKVLDDNLNGSYSWYASGITWAADNGTKVINLSVRAPRRRRPGEGRETTPGATGRSSWPPPATPAARAGSTRPTTPTPSPCRHRQPRPEGFLLAYGVGRVDLAAPGVNVFSTIPNHPFENGTIHWAFKGLRVGSVDVLASGPGLVYPYGTSNSSVRNCLQAAAGGIPGTGTYLSAARIKAAGALAP